MNDESREGHEDAAGAAMIVPTQVGEPRAAQATSVAGELDRRMSWWIPSMVAGTVAAIVRLLYVLDLRTSVAFDQPLMDAFVHDGWARGTIRLFFEDVPYFRAPLYPWFLEFLYAVNDGYLWPRLVQVLLGVLTVSLVADLGRRLAGPVAGLAAGLLLALCWPVIFFTGELLSVTLFCALIVGALWLLVVAGASDRRSLAVAAVALLGIATMARPIALVFLPALVWLALRVWPRSGAPMLGAWRWRGAVILVIVALLPGLALTVRNKVVGNDWVFLASQGAVSFFIGNNAQSDGHAAVVPGTSETWIGGYRDTVARAEAAAGRPLAASEVSAYYVREGLSYWAEEPGAALRLLGTKLRFLLGAGERNHDKNLHFWRAESRVLSLPLYTSWAPIFALGVVGIWLSRRRREAAPLWSFLGLYSLGLLAFFLDERFRLPLTVVLSVFAGVTVAHLIARVRARDWQRTGALCGVVVVLLVGSGADRLDFSANRIDADASSHHIVGNMYMSKGDFHAAAVSYQTSLSIARQFDLQHFERVEPRLRASLVRALFRLHLFDEADVHLRALEQLRPNDVDVLALRGRYYLWLHQPNLALPPLRRALDIAPDHPEALLGLVWCQIADEQWVPARRNVDRVLERTGRNPEALAAKGVQFLHGERSPQRARRTFEDVLRTHWDTPAAHHYLAVVFLRENNIPRAIYHLREALRLDPKNLWVSRYLTRSRAPFEHPEGTTRPEL